VLSAIIRVLALAVLLAGGIVVDGEAAGRRVALVIGNSDYASVNQLDNPKNDAAGVAQRLRALGFEVTLALDLDKAGFERALRDFAGSLDGAEAALFYYAGHGLQVDGRNYMVPVDANVANEADLPFQLVAVDIALQRLANRRITSIIVLDACRNNPLSDKLATALGERADAVGQGLASVYADVGTLISFSTQPGNVALDGDGPNSPFTEALLKHIATPNVDVLAMMKDVRRDVVASTGKRQVPWDTSSLVDEFFFKRAAETPEPQQEDEPKESEVKTEPNAEPQHDARDEPPPQPDEVKESESERPEGEIDLSHLLPPDDDDAVKQVLSGRPPVVSCDTVAASPTDPERAAPGVVIGSLDGEAGVKACRAALAKYPNTPRFEFQLARSLQVTKAYDEAARLYAELVKRGYLAALVNYGWLLNNGQGVQQDQKAAVRQYLLAAQQGDMFGMFNVAMAYDSGEGLPFNPAQAADWIYAALRLGHDYSIKRMSGPATGWTKGFRVELQRLLKQAGLYRGKLDGVFGPEVWTAVAQLQTLPFAPSPGGAVPAERWDPTSIPTNAPMPP
jgi:Caspase domain/Putative peptidoglycan binding domain